KYAARRVLPSAHAKLRRVTVGRWLHASLEEVKTSKVFLHWAPRCADSAFPLSACPLLYIRAVTVINVMVS
ncbi:MAG: hypothetical protein ACKOAG_02695, partial [Candidatus Kapaibacterium sp.]